MIIKSDNAEFKRIFELLQEEGYIVNKFSDWKIVLQKEKTQIKLIDLELE